MGVYTETTININCKTKTAAKAVIKELRKLQKTSSKKWGEIYPQTIKQYDTLVEAFTSSDRSQSVEYQCEQMWKKIKKINGVIDFSAPFMQESNGITYEK